VLRIATCLWLLKELLLRWPAFNTLYSNHSFLNVQADKTHLLRNCLYQLKENYILIIYACIALLVLNILGIGRNLVSVFLFLTVALLYSMNSKFTNGGDLMALLLTFYLSAANTFSHFTLLKRQPFSGGKEKLYNVISNLAAYSIMLNLSFVYFMSGLGKLEDPLWRSGMAIHYFINNEHYFLFAAGGRHIELPKSVLYLLNHGTILLELTAPFLIWHKRFRFPALSLLFLMHAVIYCFFMLYGMSVIFVMQYGLFFREEEIKRFLLKMKSYGANIGFPVAKRQG
jgi:hypothetical protein